jgi:hypothetical protein
MLRKDLVICGEDGRKRFRLDIGGLLSGGDNGM